MDLTGYKLTFDDEFNSASVSNDGPQNGTLWTNHFWYNGNQGGIETDLPGNISVANGAATIAAQNTGSGWTGGVLSSVDSSINGFTQEYGYFEMRAQMPSGSGAWPAFWLISADHAKNAAAPASELDIFEGQGNQTSTDFTTMHSYASGSHWQNSDNAHQVADTSQGYHTYGLSWTPDTVTWYYDGQAMQTLPTQPDQHVPMMILANLGVGNMWGNNMPNGSTPNTMGMNIDYIRAYSNDPNAHAVTLDHVSSPDGADTTPYGAADASGGITGSHDTAAAAATPAPAPAPATAPAAPTPDPVADNNAPAATPDAVPPQAPANNDAGNTASNAAGADHLTLHVSGDLGTGDAPQFVVKVDGQQVGGTLSTTASHDAGQWQDVTVDGNFGSGAHKVEIGFVNDANSGTHATDRNLYVGGVDVDGHHVDGSAFTSNDASLGYDSLDKSAAVMVTNGTATYQVPGDAAASATAAATADAAAPAPAATPDSAQAAGNTVVLHVAGDQAMGDAPQFVLSVDGKQVGGTLSATASHDAGATQDVAVNVGNLDPSQAHDVAISFVNDAFGGSHATDRNLYVEGLDINGKHVDGNAFATNDAALDHGSLDPNAAVMVANGTASFHVAADYWHHA